MSINFLSIFSELNCFAYAQIHVRVAYLFLMSLSKHICNVCQNNNSYKGGGQPAQTGIDSKHPCACVASVNKFVSLLAQRLINILDQQGQNTKQI